MFRRNLSPTALMHETFDIMADPVQFLNIFKMLDLYMEVNCISELRNVTGTDLATFLISL